MTDPTETVAAAIAKGCASRWPEDQRAYATAAIAAHTAWLTANGYVIVRRADMAWLLMLADRYYCTDEGECDYSKEYIALRATLEEGK